MWKLRPINLHESPSLFESNNRASTIKNRLKILPLKIPLLSSYEYDNKNWAMRRTLHILYKNDGETNVTLTDSTHIFRDQI